MKELLGFLATSIVFALSLIIVFAGLALAIKLMNIISAY